MTSNQRKRKRRALQASQEFCLSRLSRQRGLDGLDEKAIQEAVYMKRAYVSRTMDFGRRLNFKYYIDGIPHLTGKRHRLGSGGGYNQDKRV